MTEPIPPMTKEWLADRGRWLFLLELDMRMGWLSYSAPEHEGAGVAGMAIGAAEDQAPTP